MNEAIKLAEMNIITMNGGPFGAVVVKDGKIVGRSGNKVLQNNDPTAHAEVQAMRDAGHNLGTFDLSDCVLYTSCEPCPMCLLASLWGNVKEIYYAATRVDAENAGFRDNHFYEMLKDDVKTGIHLKEAQNKAAQVMLKWAATNDKKLY